MTVDVTGAVPMQTDSALGSPVPLDGYTMYLRRSELRLVASGMVEANWFKIVDPLALPDALERLGTVDRAPVWELAVRHFGRRKPLAHAAAEIGMHALHARDLLEALARSLSGSQPFG